MDIPWISITGVRTIEDIYIIDRAIKNTNTKTAIISIKSPKHKINKKYQNQY